MAVTPQKLRADGNAYGRTAGDFDAELTQVGPGTPAGELLRRYWHPIALSSDVIQKPQQVRLLGEDLILFRDGQGRCGLLTPRCAHRGASLYYGKIDNDGIRCCYHGWQFDVQGRCIDQPCEPERGAKHRDRVRQPWYPTQERYGLVFAYLGPPERQPPLPRWDTLEELSASEKILASGPTGFGVGADHTVRNIPWNWLQNMENTMDPFHIPILHSAFSGTHFVPDMGIMPEVHFEYSDLGMRYRAYFRNTPSGRDVVRVSPVIFPNVRSVPDGQLREGRSIHITWMVPFDDTSHGLFYASRVPLDFSGPIGRAKPPDRAKVWSEMTEEEHRDAPDDWEAQMGQGPITLHSEEHLARSDRGVVMMRRMLREEIRKVADGQDPLNAGATASSDMCRVNAGNYVEGQVPAGVDESVRQ